MNAQERCVVIVLNIAVAHAARSALVVDLGSGCKFPSGVVYAAPSGKCAAPPNSAASTTDRSQVNLMELNINAVDGDDNYDLSSKVQHCCPVAMHTAWHSLGDDESMECQESLTLSMASIARLQPIEFD